MSKVKEKPNCYKCEYRGTIPGNCHSKCEHPAFKEMNDDPMLKLASILGGASGGLPPIEAKGITVKGNEHGIRSGWFNHPLNFDPTWLEECSGFISKAAK